MVNLLLQLYYTHENLRSDVVLLLNIFIEN